MIGEILIKGRSVHLTKVLRGQLRQLHVADDGNDVKLDDRCIPLRGPMRQSIAGRIEPRIKNSSTLIEAAARGPSLCRPFERTSRFLASASVFDILPMRTLRRLRSHPSIAAHRTASTRSSTCRVDIDDLPRYFTPPGRWLKAAVGAASSGVAPNTLRRAALEIRIRRFPKFKAGSKPSRTAS